MVGLPSYEDFNGWLYSGKIKAPYDVYTWMESQLRVIDRSEIEKVHQLVGDTSSDDIREALDIMDGWLGETEKL